MAEWPALPISSWREFVEVVEPLDIGPPSNVAYIFRGQADETWSLRHSLARRMPEDIGLSEAIKVESVLMRKFQQQAHLFTDVAKFDDTDLPCYWMLMQHHRAPTRVLDWTASPFIALYFAVNEQPNKNAVVYIIHQGLVIRNFKERFGDDYDAASRPNRTHDALFRDSTNEMLFPLRLVRSFQRPAVQQSSITVSTNILANHGDALLDILGEVESDVTKYHKLIIPAQLKAQFLQRLRMMNITPNSLFPGLDGLGMDISDLAYLESRPADRHSE